jgi:aspartate kinase
MLVMKFGGTSVADSAAIMRLVAIVKSRLSRHPVVVVSALAQATDMLHQAAILAAEGNLAFATKQMNELKQRHFSITQDLINDAVLLHSVNQKITNYFAEIANLLQGISLLNELSNRSIARVITFGELLSSTVIAAVFTANNLQNVLLDAREFIITDDNYLKGEPNLTLINQKVPAIIKPLVDDGNVVLTQGFLACNSKGDTTTLGRGGSDYSASLIGMALNATEIEIWTDVDGMLTADPRKVKNTKLIATISFAEAAELAYFGAKVLHPLTIQPAMEKNIPVRILNAMHAEKSGTLILPETPTNFIEAEGANIKSIACKEHITSLNIFSTKMLNSYGFLKRVFEIFDKNRTSVDLITTSEVNVSLTLDNDDYLPNIVEELSHFSEVKVEPDKSLVCVVGKNIKNTKGIAKRVFQALGDVNITMISQGASVINLSFVVDRCDLNQVMQNMHDEFFGS